jgi:DNA polymerase-1
LVKNLGWSEAKAKRVEKNYHELYTVSDDWVADKLNKAGSSGFVEGCFGLRLRTPLLAKTIKNHRTTPFQAQAEGRSAGNMVSGQSYGQLTNRAAVEFMEKVWASPHRTKILPVAMIHDAIYLVIQEDIDVIKFVNDELIASMAWQELSEIRHESIKLSSKLDIFWPSWANSLEIPNYATSAEITQLCGEHGRKME